LEQNQERTVGQTTWSGNRKGQKDMLPGAETEKKRRKANWSGNRKEQEDRLPGV
jgi:hypothetical protein